MPLSRTSKGILKTFPRLHAIPCSIILGYIHSLGALEAYHVGCLLADVVLTFTVK